MKIESVLSYTIPVWAKKHEVHEAHCCDDCYYYSYNIMLGENVLGCYIVSGDESRWSKDDNADNYTCECQKQYLSHCTCWCDACDGLYCEHNNCDCEYDKIKFCFQCGNKYCTFCYGDSEECHNCWIDKQINTNTNNNNWIEEGF
jgi:hypothetical protein